MAANYDHLPSSFVERMQATIGMEASAAFLASLSSQAPVSVRWNPWKLSASPFEEGRRIPWHPQGIFLPQRPSFVSDPLFHAGAYYVQEASSMLLYQLLDTSRPLNILDLCGAPGGKSTLIASAMHPGSLLVANEVIRSRAAVLEENLTKWGHPHCMITQSDPAAFSKLPNFFDLIMVDAPCSGEGMFRKDPSSIECWSDDHVLHCASRQRRILADVLPCLKEEGRLIYSTCTYSPEENEQNIAWLLREFSGELELDCQVDLGQWGAEAVKLQGQTAGWKCYPHQFEGEGFFISRLKKIRSADGENHHRKAGRHKHKHTGEVTAFLDRFTVIEERESVIVEGDKIFYRPAGIFADVLFKSLRVINAGVMLGTIRRKEVSPGHTLSVSTLANPGLPAVELDLDKALQYLRKMEWNEESVSPGWVLSRYRNINLGWFKSTGKKLKNHYPMNWRIRKRL